MRFFKHRDNVKSGQLRIKFIGTKQNVSDFFTKALLRVDFYKFRALCMNELEMAEVEMWLALRSNAFMMRIYNYIQWYDTHIMQ